jgi:PAS domain S-box-containing protein
MDRSLGMSPADSRPVGSIVRLRRHLPLVAALGMALTGSVLAGWWADIAFFKTILPGLASMKANTAIGLLAAFAALWLWTSRPRGPWQHVLEMLCAALAFLLAAATLVEYGLGIDLHIDQLLAKDDLVAPLAAAPGRMGADTALNMALVGAALLLARIRSRAAKICSQYLAAIALALAFAVLLGYVFSATTLIGIQSYTQMALHTSASFVVLTLALLLATIDTGFMAEIASGRQGGMLVRRLLPIIVITIPLAGWLRLMGERMGYFHTELGLAFFALFNVVFLSAVMVAAAYMLNRSAKAEEAMVAELRESERRFRHLVEGSLQGIVIQRRGKPLFANDAYARMLGYDSAKEVLELDSLERFIAPQEIERATRYWDIVLRGEGEVPADEVQGRRRDGSSLWVYRELHRVMWDGEPAIQATFLDITARKLAEEQLVQALKMEAVGQLTGGVAHDFNNLLTVILGNLDLLVEDLEERQPTLVKLADRVRDAALRGAALTQRLLAFSRRQILQPTVLDLNQVVRGMNDLLRRSLGETIEVETVSTAGLWPALADKSQVENALLNLAVNARDAMPDGGKLTIETGNVRLDDAYAAANLGVKAGRYVMLAVTDTGTGMSPEVMARVYDPFFTTKEVGKGTGLGLSMVFGFAKQSDGHVKIYSEEGQGTTVKLYLPRAPSAEAVQGAAPEAAAPRAPRGEGILVVEDDPDLRETVKGMLTRLGYTVTVAPDGPAALAEIDKGIRVDLLFTDVVMPQGMSGRQLADEAQRRRPGLKVLFTSGYTQNAIVHHGRLDEGVAMIGKPYSTDDLARRIARILASRTM